MCENSEGNSTAEYVRHTKINNLVAINERTKVWNKFYTNKPDKKHFVHYKCLYMREDVRRNGAKLPGFCFHL